MGQFQCSGVSWGPTAGGPGEPGGSPGASEVTCVVKQVGPTQPGRDGWAMIAMGAGSLVLM